MMNEARARVILGKRIRLDGGLSDDEEFLEFGPGDDVAVLDGLFSADELEAIAWWMRNKCSQPESSR